ncbi:hypothetical protein Tco_1320980 [Tanacetum coccineum]
MLHTTLTSPLAEEASILYTEGRWLDKDSLAPIATIFGMQVAVNRLSRNNTRGGQETCKAISVAENLRHLTLVQSFSAAKRKVGEEQHGLLRSHIVDAILPNQIWTLEASGVFIVQSTRNLIDDKILPKVEVPTKWVKVIPIKVNVHA